MCIMLGESDSRKGTKVGRGIYKGIYPALPRKSKYKRRGKKSREKKPLTHKVLERMISTLLRKRPPLAMSSTPTHSPPAVLLVVSASLDVDLELELNAEEEGFASVLRELKDATAAAIPGLGEGAADCSGARQAGRAAREMGEPPAETCRTRPALGAQMEVRTPI
jgi:hypothetical protein